MDAIMPRIEELVSSIVESVLAAHLSAQPATPAVVQATAVEDSTYDDMEVKSATIPCWGELDVSDHGPYFGYHTEEDRELEPVTVVPGYEVEPIEESTLDPRIAPALECEALYYSCVCLRAIAPRYMDSHMCIELAEIEAEPHQLRLACHCGTSFSPLEFASHFKACGMLQESLDASLAELDRQKCQ